MICSVTAENFELLTPAAPQLHLSDRHVLRHNGCHESPTELPKSDLGATTHGSVNVHVLIGISGPYIYKQP